MKLIAETQEESSKLNGLSALLLDLGIDVDSYENEEAIEHALDRAELGKVPARNRLEPFE